VQAVWTRYGNEPCVCAGEGRQGAAFPCGFAAFIVAYMSYDSSRSSHVHESDDSTSPDQVRRALEAAGCRYTKQRAAVLACLRATDRHPTVDQVFQAVRQERPTISLATVYTALEALVEARLATKHVGEDIRARYDGRGENHYHLRDTATGELRDLPIAYDPHLLEMLDPGLIERLAGEGFRVTGYRLEVLGRYEGSDGGTGDAGSKETMPGEGSHD